MGRFIQLYGSIELENLNNVEYFDMRYTNGVSVKKTKIIYDSKNDKNIIAALDVGTSKIVTLVAEISEDRSIDIIGYGICESKGLKRGIVVDIEATVESIKKSIGEAERTSGHNILSLVTGIAGNHIRSISSTGTVPITNNEVTQDDLDAVLESASAITIPGDQKILHRIPQSTL